MKKITLMALLSATFAFGQTTETFETETDDALSFDSNGKLFDLSGVFHIENYPTFGYGTSDYYIDNSNTCGTTGPIGIISTNDGLNVNLNYVWVFPSLDCTAPGSGNIKVYWYKDGIEISTMTYPVAGNISVDDGFVKLDFDLDGQSSISADEWRFEAEASLNYVAIDDFTWTACTEPDIPTLTYISPSNCSGDKDTIQITGNLNDATEWHVYTNSCGVNSLGWTTSDKIGLTSNATTTYYVRGEGACTTPALCASVVGLNTNINTSVLSSDPTLTSNATGSSNANGATLQWLDCNNGFAPINGATSYIYTAPINGSYAVEITLDGCVDTSGCNTIETVDIESGYLESAISIFPNPTSENITISLGQLNENVTIILRNVLGQEISRINNPILQNVALTIEGNDGIYFMEIITESGDASVHKILKKQ